MKRPIFCLCRFSFNFCGVSAQQTRWSMQQNEEHLLQLLGTKRIHAIFYCRQTTLCCNDLTQRSKVADVVDMLGYALTERRIWFLPEVGLPSNKAGVLLAINLQDDFLYVFRHKSSWTLLIVWIGPLWRAFSLIETLCEALIFPATRLNIRVHGHLQLRTKSFALRSHGPCHEALQDDKTFFSCKKWREHQTISEHISDKDSWSHCSTRFDSLPGLDSLPGGHPWTFASRLKCW